MKIKFTIILFLCVITSVFSQDPLFINISNKKELPDVEFYDVLEDKSGFIWLAAEKGLYRYDGTSFKQFTAKNQRGLSVFLLNEGPDRRIWCMNFTGQIFYTNGNELHEFIDINHLIDGRLPRFLIEKDWIRVITFKGIYKIHLKTKEIQTIKDSFLTRARGVSLVKEKGKLYYLANGLLIEREGEIKEVKKFKRIEHSLYATSSEIYYVNYTVTKNKISSKLYSYKENENVLEELKLPQSFTNKRIVNILEEDNLLWITTNLGVFAFERKKRSLVLKSTFFETDFITKVLKDKNQNYWFTTLNNGVYIVPDIHILKEKLPNKKSQIKAFTIINDHFVYGFEDGEIVIENIKTKKKKSFYIDKRKAIAFGYNKWLNELLISLDYKSVLLDFNTNVIEEVYNMSSAKKITFLDEKMFYSSSSFWGSINNIIRKKVKGKIRKINYRTPKFGKKVLKSKSTFIKKTKSYEHIIDKDSIVYSSHIDGLFYFNIKDSTYQYKEIRYKDNPIYGFDFTKTSDGILWVATLNKGILGIRSNKIVEHISFKEGLQSSTALKIKGDGKNIWVASSKGISLVDRRFSEVTVKKIPFVSKEIFSKILTIEIHENNLFIVGNRGIVSINRDEVCYTKPEQEIYFTGVKIAEREEKNKPAYLLNYDETSIEIFFNSNGFNPEGKTYKYRLKGVEKNWKYTTSNTVRYSILPYGKFTFEIQTLSNNAPIKKIEITVKKPFWLKGWFLLVVLLAFLLIVHLFYKKELRKNQQLQLEHLKQETIKKRLVMSQLENLRSQMNPHFIFNALNSIQEYILMNEKYLASTYLAEFSTLIRMYLSHSKKDKITLEEEIMTLNIYLKLEKDRFEELEYIINNRVGNEMKKISIPCFLIQPYVENALKHGLIHKKGKKRLEINISQTEFLKIEIIDNGVGRKEASRLIEKDYESFSTKANKDRIDLINIYEKYKIDITTHDLYDINKNAIGTKVEILIPINDESLNN